MTAVLIGWNICMKPILRAQHVLLIQDELKRQERIESIFTNPIACIRALWNREGFVKWVKVIAIEMSLEAVRFVAGRAVHRGIEVMADQITGGVDLQDSAVTSVVATLAVQAVTHPFDVLTEVYTGPFQTSETKPQLKSAMSLYSGFGLELVGSIAHQLVQYAMYSAAMQVTGSDDLSFLTVFAVASGSLVLIHPFSVIRGRMIASVGGKRQYSSVIQCVASMIEEGKITTFFSGAQMGYGVWLLSAVVRQVFELE